MADTTQTTTQEAQQQTVDGKAAVGKPPQKSFTGDQINDSPSKSSTNGTSAEKDTASAGGRQRHGTNERKDAVPSSTGGSQSSATDKTINGSASAHVANADDTSTASAGAGGRISPTRQPHATDSSAAAGGDSGSKKRSADQTTTGSDGRRSRNSGTAASANTSIGTGGHADATVNDPEKSAEHDLAGGSGTTSKDAGASKRAKVDTEHSQKPTIAGGDEDKGPISSSGTGHSAVAVDTPNLNKPHSDSDKVGGTHGGSGDAASSGGAVGSSGQA